MMAQNEIAEVSIAGGGKSSAMHHKSNPVQAEILIAIGRYNAALLGGFINPSSMSRNGPDLRGPWNG